jgi:predicted DsbA family dithiol-disulfide isomerase
MHRKILVEIWSDVMCPFCYIGKRKFENALTQFPEANQVEIIWRSFQLSPNMKTDPSKSINQFLAEHKKISVVDAKRMNDRVTEMASQVGLSYNFDKSVVANSFNAHRFTHFAKINGKQNEAEEKLFHAYFTDGKNIDDFKTLIQLGKEIGLEVQTLQAALESNKFANDVVTDIEEARQLGIQGVPFFVFNRKYGVSGAQDQKVFLKTLEESLTDS